jgi:short-subunit dehydrogenase
VCIAITSSTNGLVPADADFAPVYVATKFGINGFVHAMAPIARRLNFRINAIAPVTVQTPMVEAAGITDDMRAFLSRHGRGGIMPPAAVAAGLLRLIDEPEINGEVRVCSADDNV